MTEREPIPPAPRPPLWRQSWIWGVFALLLLAAGAAKMLLTRPTRWQRQIALPDLYDPKLGIVPASVYYDFNPTSVLQGDWGPPEGTETDHTAWIVGPNAAYHFKIAPLSELYRVCVRAGPFYVDGLRTTPQGQSFELNGEFIGKWQQTERRPGFFNWCTDVDSTQLKNGDNVLAIKTLHFASPKALGLSGDDRKLGVLVDWISVFPSNFGQMTVPAVSVVQAGEVLSEPKLIAKALRLASGGAATLPVAIPPSAMLELGLPAVFIEKGGILSVSFKPDSGPVKWKQIINPSIPPVRSLFQVNFYRIDLSPVERTTGSLILSYEPSRMGSPDYALLVDPVILTPVHPVER
jgi:hypothetical protein